MRRSMLYGVFCAFLALVFVGCGGSAAVPRIKVLPLRAPVVMVLGDSYTAGINEMPPEKSYAAEAARRLGWQIIIGGYRGTGFLAAGRIRKTFATLYDEELAWRPAPDLMVVSGGHNDWSKPPALVGTAAQDLLLKIKQRWPGIKVVLLGPMWGGDPTPAALSIRDAVRSAAVAANVPFVDPLGEKWVTGSVKLGTGNAPQYIRRDGVHPSDEGCRYLATRFVAVLQRLGVSTPPRA